MDVVEIFRAASDRLPQAEYSVGLQAIIRHLESAIRHYHRDPFEEEDCYTDSIYRTNQAYEGSLKEAYRVLASKDPAGKTPNEIERYLEENKILRPRVLTQLSRYRQDYRNPSTHDYRLDFDANEALLAIVSVAAFCKLLVDQIYEHIVFRTSEEQEPVSPINISVGDDKAAFKIAEYIRDYCNNNDNITTPEAEFRAALAGSISGAGYTATTEYESSFFWDIVITAAERKIAVETRKGDNRHSASKLIPVSYLAHGIDDGEVSDGIVVTRVKQKGNYAVLRVFDETHSLLLVTKLDRSSIKSRLGPRWNVEV